MYGSPGVSVKLKQTLLLHHEPDDTDNKYPDVKGVVRGVDASQCCLGHVFISIIRSRSNALLFKQFHRMGQNFYPSFTDACIPPESLKEYSRKVVIVCLISDSKEDLLGECSVQMQTLLEGFDRKLTTDIKFISPPDLWDEKGKPILIDDPRYQGKVTGKAAFQAGILYADCQLPLHQEEKINS